MTPDISKQALFIIGRILHQGTGEAITGQVRITALEAPVFDKVRTDGTFAISGQIDRLFPKDILPPYPVTLKIRADSAQFRQGFIEYTFPVKILGGPDFDPDPPTAPTAPINVGTIRLPVDPSVDPTADPNVYRENMQVNIRGRVVTAKDSDTPISGATLNILQSGVSTNSTTTNVDGRYRFDNIIVKAPAKIQCSAPRFQNQSPRILQIDFGKLINEEYFRLTPP